MVRSRIALACAALLCSVAPAIPENDPDNWRETFARDRQAFLSPTPIASAKTRTPRTRVPAIRFKPDPAIVALVDRVASEAGIPVAVMRDHVRRESGFRPGARNPRSTATGLLQVIKSSHEAIIGRRLTLAEHIRLSSDPEYSLRVGAAHMKLCMTLIPGATALRLYDCHYHGHARFGGSIQMAAHFYRPDRNGWLAIGSVAMPWASREQGGA